MALRSTVKVGNITNLSDARYCAGMGVELLGFNINPNSDDYVNPELFHAIKGWIEGVKYVLEYDGDGIPDFSDYDFDFIEITNPEKLQDLEVDPSKAILRVNADRSDFLDLIEANKDFVTFFDLFSDQDLINQDLESFLNSNSVFLGFGFDKSNINGLLDRVPELKISLKGTKEIKPGFKDYDELADILEEIEVDY